MPDVYANWYKCSSSWTSSLTSKIEIPEAPFLAKKSFQQRDFFKFNQILLHFKCDKFKCYPSKTKHHKGPLCSFKIAAKKGALNYTKIFRGRPKQGCVRTIITVTHCRGNALHSRQRHRVQYAGVLCACATFVATTLTLRSRRPVSTVYAYARSPRAAGDYDWVGSYAKHNT